VTIPMRNLESTGPRAYDSEEIAGWRKIAAPTLSMTAHSYHFGSASCRCTR
jgi:hypothetical protein